MHHLDSLNTDLLSASDEPPVDGEMRFLWVPGRRGAHLKSLVKTGFLLDFLPETFTMLFLLAAMSTDCLVITLTSIQMQ